MEQLHAELAEIKIHVVEIRKDLAYHIKRTDVAEDRLERLEERDAELQGAKKLIKVLGACLTTGTAVLAGLHLLGVI